LAARSIAHTALFLSITIALPFAFHQFGIAGRIFLPMHIPVLMAGLMMGTYPALIIGLAAPLLSHLLTAMPPAYAVPLMTMELPIYGITAALAYKKLRLNIYVALLISMIVGRLVFALGLLLLGLFISLPYGPAEFFALGGAVVTGIPGMIVQFIVIPPLVISIKRISRGD
jgi:hypothetical protein